MTSAARGYWKRLHLPALIAVALTLVGAGFYGDGSTEPEQVDAAERATGVIAAAAPPVAVDDALRVPVGSTTFPLYVLLNDTGPLSRVQSATSTASGGTVDCRPELVCLYTPKAGAPAGAADSFDYTAISGGLTDVGRVNIAVVADSPPVAADDAFTMSRTAGRRTLSVLANDTNEVGSLVISSATAPTAGGSVACGETTCTYTAPSNPAEGFVDTFNYTVSDGATSDTASVRLTTSNCPTHPVTGWSAPGLVTASTWVRCPDAQASAVTTVVPAGMASGDNPRLLLSTGSAAAATAPNDAAATTTAFGTSDRGARDVSILRLDLNVPATARCLSFDFVFGSEEFPEFAVTDFNDAFLAELDKTTWHVEDGSRIVPPDNFATDPGGALTSIGSQFFDGVATGANGTEYDGVTPVLTARTPITPGAHTLYLSLLDAGDDRTDSAVFVDRLSTSSDLESAGCRRGVETSGAPADLDGDGATDVAVFRPAGGRWYRASGGPPVVLGTSGDVPVAADYDGDGDAEPAVYRPSTGQWLRQGLPTVVWGTLGDVPVPGDYDGDGDAEPAVFRPSNGRWYVSGVVGSVAFGAVGDIPTPGQWDADLALDVGVFRPGNGRWYRHGDPNAIAWGTAGDVPVHGQWDADPSTDIAVYRPSSSRWYLHGQPTAKSYGTAGDVPVPGDYDGNGTLEIAVYRPSSSRWYLDSKPTVHFGTAGDVPVPRRLAVAP